MSFKILEFTVNPSKPRINMPESAEILSAAFNNEGQCIIFVECDDSLEFVKSRYIHIFSTGETIPYNMGIDFNFLFTIFNNGKAFHIFEREGI